MSDYTSHIDTEATELDLMERYLAGSLTADEQREMESTLAEDPVLADALEGLALIEDKEEMKLALGRIQEGSRRQINKYVKKRDQLSKRRSRVGHGNFKRTNYYVAAAAAVAVLICTVWVIDMSSRKTSTTLAQATEGIEKQSAPELDEKDIVLAPSILDTAQENKTARLTDNVESLEPQSHTQSRIEDRRRESSNERAREIRDEAAEENSLIAFAEVEEDEDQELSVTKESAPPLGSTAAKPAPVTSAPPADLLEKRQDKMEEIVAANVPAARKQEATRTTGADLAAEQAPQKTAPILSEAELDRIPLEEGLADDSDSEKFESKKSRKAKARDAKTRYKGTAKKDIPAQSEADAAYGKIAKGQHMADLMVEAVTFYEAEANEKALPLLKEVLQTSPENPAANFYTGSIYRRYSQMKTATSYLKEATKYPQSPLFEDARWELAQVYLARNKNGLAKKLLTKIAKAGSRFAEQAREELNKME